MKNFFQYLTTMENRNINYVGGGIIILLLALAIFGFVSNSKNKKNLEAERIQTQTLTNENLQVREELQNLKSDYGSLTTLSDSTSRMLEESEKRAKQGSNRIATLSREKKELDQVRVELEELQKSNAELDKNYADLKLENEKALAQNKDLQSSLAATETQRNDITGRLQKTELYNADNFLVTAVRGKQDKVVACARRTKKINMAFSVPQNLTDSVTYRIETPSGNTLNPNVAFIFPDQSQYLVAGLSGFYHAIQNPKQVTLSYVPEEKLEKGEYNIQLLSNGNNIGNCRLILK